MENIKEFKVLPVGKKLYCHNCDDVELECRPEVYLTSPPQYKYECPYCDYSVSTHKHYPCIEFKWLD